MSERVQVKLETAIEMLGESKRIHTFVTANPGMLIGADWERDEVLKLFKSRLPELSGPAAASLNHRLCCHDGKRWVFFETLGHKETGST